MRPRLALAQRALRDYQERRFYSCVLVLLPVLDGFVNDFEPLGVGDCMRERARR